MTSPTPADSALEMVGPSPCSAWRMPYARIALGKQDVHVWRIPLDRRDLAETLASVLSSEEEGRLRRFLSDDARRRYIVAHGAARDILSRYVDQRAEDLPISTDCRGKPQLLTAAGMPDVRFSLSHSGELALCAVACGRDTGVDLERIRPLPLLCDMAERYFSPEEQEALRLIPENEASEAFLNLWTRKEAVSKALGDGISRRWTQFTVPLQADAGPERVQIGQAGQPVALYTVCPLAPGPGYLGAVAGRGTTWRLSCWEYC